MIINQYKYSNQTVLIYDVNNILTGKYDADNKSLVYNEIICFANYFKNSVIIKFKNADINQNYSNNYLSLDVDFNNFTGINKTYLTISDKKFTIERISNSIFSNHKGIITILHEGVQQCSFIEEKRNFIIPSLKDEGLIKLNPINENFIKAILLFASFICKEKLRDLNYGN